MNFYRVYESDWDKLQANMKLREANPAAPMPEGLLLPEPEHVQILQDVQGYCWTFDDSGWEFAPPNEDGWLDHISRTRINGWPEEMPTNCAAIRGEAAHDCVCRDGYLVVDITSTQLPEFGLQVTLNRWCKFHSACNITLPAHVIDVILRAVPPSHRAHRVVTMASTDRSPITSVLQLKMIAKLPRTEETLRGWLLAGPPGSSKTSYVAASVLDILTWRACFAKAYDIAVLNYHRVKIPSWLAEMQAYDTRDFEDDRMRPPDLTPEWIGSASSFRPLLWLEELDKFTPTKARLQYIFRLVDAVYECGGLVIVTCNMSPGDLREHLGDAIYRRIAGDNDDPTDYLVWDLYGAVRQSEKQGGK